jgi:fructokinase
VPQSVLVVGESLVDVVISPTGETIDTKPGGAPLNIAVGLARLDLPTWLLTTFADDEHGRLVAAHARASRVRLLDESRSMSPTSVARALLDDRNEATYEFELHWDPPPVELPGDLAAVHVGSLGTVVDPGRQAVHELVGRATQAGVPVTYDPNVRPAVSTDAAAAWSDVRRWAESADVVKMSDADAAYLRPDLDADGLLDAVLTDGRTALAVLTQGAKGTVLATDRHRVSVPAPSVEVVDTVGAGDSFMSGLLAALVERDLLAPQLTPERLPELTQAALAEIGAFAARVAAVTCSRRGADPPRRHEL